MIQTKRFALLLAIGCGAAASAQTSIARVLPPSPNSNDVIVGYVYAPALCDGDAHDYGSGNVVRTDVLLEGCLGGPPPFNTIHETQFGPLPAGTYTYEVYARDRFGPPAVLVDQELIIVSPAPAHVAAIPTLGTFELTLL